MARSNGPEGLITIYEQETRPGLFRYMTMCPVRLSVLIDPMKMGGDITRHRAASLIAKAALYHLKIAHSPARAAEMLDLIQKMKKYTDAPATTA